MTILLDGDLQEIVSFQHVKPGKGGAFVRTRFKNVLTGRVVEKTFRAGEKFEEAELEMAPYQFLYHDGDLYHFMHPDTYEQIEVGEDVVGDNKLWLKENGSATLLFYKGRAIKSSVPVAVELRIIRCDPGVQGDRATGGSKPATLETGAVVQVPLFVNEGEIIKVDTRTSEYLERVSS